MFSYKIGVIVFVISFCIFVFCFYCIYIMFLESETQPGLHDIFI
jgi:hypothetical protein